MLSPGAAIARRRVREGGDRVEIFELVRVLLRDAELLELRGGLRDDVGVDVLAARDDARDGRGRTPTAVQGVGFSGVGVRDATDEWRFVARARRADVDQGEGDDRGEGAICGARSGADGACCARRLGVRR